MIPTPPLPPTRPNRSSTSAPESTTRAADLPIAEIRLNPRQPRRRFSEAALDELAASIKRTGLLQPVLVRKVSHGYELIAGERRLRAAKRAGLTHLPVIFRRGTDQEQLELALIENLQREDLSPIEEALGYERLVREFLLTQEEIARKVGKERSTVTNLIRLLKLPKPVQELVNEKAISMGHARALLGLEDPRRQEALAKRVEKEGLSVRQVEQMIRGLAAKSSRRDRRMADKAKTDPNLRHLANEFQRVLGTRVEIVPRRGRGGEIRVQFYNPDDLRRLRDQIIGK